MQLIQNSLQISMLAMLIGMLPWPLNMMINIWSWFGINKGWSDLGEKSALLPLFEVKLHNASIFDMFGNGFASVIGTETITVVIWTAIVMPVMGVLVRLVKVEGGTLEAI